MVNAMQYILSMFRPQKPRVFGQRGAVALITALATPLLLAVTGLSVDVGFWYQQQESLQNASDAGALAAASAAVAYNSAASNAATFATTTGQAFATEAANLATNNQFNLTSSGSYKIIVAGTTSGSSATFTATSTVPRGSFFSAVKGLGLPGLPTGNQSTSASATYGFPVNSATPLVYDKGSASVTGASPIDVNGVLYVGTSLSAQGSSSIIGTGGVETPSSSSSVTTTGTSYIGTSSTGGTGTSTVTTNSATQSDPLSNLAAPPTFPTMPSFPSAPTGFSAAYTPQLGYNTWSQSGVGDCVQLSGNYSAACELYPNHLIGMTNIGVSKIVLNLGATNGQTYISGGFSGQSNSTTQLNGNSYYISGGVNFTSDAAFTLTAGTTNTTCGSYTAATCFIADGGVSLTNGSYTFGNYTSTGVYYLRGPTNSSGFVTGLALSLNSPVLNMGNGDFFVNGGAAFTGSNTAAHFGSGTYFFYSYNPSSVYGLTATDGSLNFDGGTYYFYGGLNISGADNLTFGPGIYYINGGPLNIDGSGSITANGATFVLENGAYLNLVGGGKLNVTAPTTNCQTYTSYPSSTYSSSFPYDGTNGEGICGLAIYQPSGTATDYISNGTSGTITGTIDTASAALNVTGAGALNLTGSSIPVALDVGSITDNGSGKVTVSPAASGSGGSSSSSASSVALLVQ